MYEATLKRAVFALGLGCLLQSAGCDVETPHTQVRSFAPALAPSAMAVRVREVERDACRAMRQNVESVPALQGAPGLEQNRHQVLGRAKGWPVVFRRPPQHDLSAMTAYYAQLAKGLADPKSAYGTLKTLRSMVKWNRKEVRAVLLPEGYLYTEDPKTAQWLVTIFRLDLLFDEPEIWLLRGSELYQLRKTKLGYEHLDGAERGELASLLLFDRVAVDKAELLPALHMDLTAAARQHGFDRVKVERISPVGVNARLRYGPDGPWVDACFTTDEARAQLACEILQDDDVEPVQQHRRDQRVRLHATEKLREAALAQVDERLPFDEPREEVGQQDGSLRPAWNWAYKRGGLGYTFNDIWYPVFDPQGRPHPPQVCIDFILDTFERASGTWYRSRSEPRERRTGSLDFESFNIPNRRGVESVVDFFRATATTFEVWDLAPEQRIRFAQTDAFLDFLRDNADRFACPNVVTIHGPRGDEAHYHSFWVFETDPVTGMPIFLAENAGKPRIRSWQSVMQNAPLRSIRNVLTPRLDFLMRTYGEADLSLATADREPISEPAEAIR